MYGVCVIQISNIQSQPESPEYVAASSSRQPKYIEDSGKPSQWCQWFVGVTTIIGICCYTVKDLTCGKIMRLFRDDLPCSEARKLGVFLDLPYSKLQDFRQNNMGKVLDQVSRGCGALWLWSSGKEDQTEEHVMSYR